MLGLYSKFFLSCAVLSSALEIQPKTQQVEQKQPLRPTEFLETAVNSVNNEFGFIGAFWTYQYIYKPLLDVNLNVSSEKWVVVSVVEDFQKWYNSKKNIWDVLELKGLKGEVLDTKYCKKCQNVILGLILAMGIAALFFWIITKFLEYRKSLTSEDAGVGSAVTYLPLVVLEVLAYPVMIGLLLLSIFPLRDTCALLATVWTAFTKSSNSMYSSTAKQWFTKVEDNWNRSTTYQESWVGLLVLTLFLSFVVVMNIYVFWRMTVFVVKSFGRALGLVKEKQRKQRRSL